MNKPVNGNGKARNTKNKSDVENEDDVFKIRDIIFGEQMREYEQRFKSLEQSLELRVRAATEAAVQQNSALREFVTAGFEKLEQRDEAEKAARTTAIGRVERALKDASSAFEARIAKLDELTAKENAEIRQELVESHNEVVAEAKALFAALDEVVQQTAEELKDTKADRTELAGLFKSFALTLSREFDVSDADA